jgi:hypothetical protein
MSTHCATDHQVIGFQVIDREAGRRPDDSTAAGKEKSRQNEF